MTFQVVVMLVIMVLCTCGANLLLKIGASGSAPNDSIIDQMNFATLGGFALFGCAFLIYAWALRVIPLNVAQAFASAQFISVIVASAWVLSEPIPFMRWVGIFTIALGIFLVGLSVD